MTVHSEDTNEAVQQLANGATVGMVDNALKQKGVGSGPRAEVLMIAKRIINRRARVKHLLIGTAGLIIVAGGAYWFYLCALNQNHQIKVPGLVIVAGLLSTAYGIYNATQNQV